MQRERNLLNSQTMPASASSVREIRGRIACLNLERQRLEEEVGQLKVAVQIYNRGGAAVGLGRTRAGFARRPAGGLTFVLQPLATSPWPCDGYLPVTSRRTRSVLPPKILRISGSL